MKEQPIFITGAERSGSSLVARIITMSGGVFTGYLNGMYENWKLKRLCQNVPLDFSTTFPFPQVKTIPTDWKQQVEDCLIKQGKRNGVWMFKESYLTRTWQIWHHHYPNAKWIIVRRKPTEIVNSCMKTQWMRLMKNQDTRKALGFETEEQAWQWWIHQYEEQWVKMIEAGLNCKVIWPDRMVDGDYSQIKETLDWLGLRWNSKIIETIDPLLNRRK